MHEYRAYSAYYQCICPHSWRYGRDSKRDSLSRKCYCLNSLGASIHLFINLQRNAYQLYYELFLYKVFIFPSNTSIVAIKSTFKVLMVIIDVLDGNINTLYKIWNTSGQTKLSKIYYELLGTVGYATRNDATTNSFHQ
jgi:hypothetical protein